MRFSPEELRSSLDGLLAFPLTPFTDDDGVHLPVLREGIERLLGAGVAGVFPACGTGEFFSLSPAEYSQVVSACVEQVGGRVPVVAGTGYGTALARSFAAAAEEAGADGLLVLPPYLVSGGPEGLEDHYRAVARSTRLGIILYQRDQAIFEPETVERLAAAPNVIGFKDGAGEAERLLRIRGRTAGRLILLNGMPTAEIHARSLAACGARAYSSAILNFMPEVATRFYRAMREGDEGAMDSLLERAVLPFAEIRRRRPGYAVALVKAGARLRDVPVGRVRPPLGEVRPEDEKDLRDLLASLELAGAPSGRSARAAP